MMYNILMYIVKALSIEISSFYCVLWDFTLQTTYLVKEIILCLYYVTHIILFLRVCGHLRFLGFCFRPDWVLGVKSKNYWNESNMPISIVIALIASENKNLYMKIMLKENKCSISFVQTNLLKLDYTHKISFYEFYKRKSSLI